MTLLLYFIVEDILYHYSAVRFLTSYEGNRFYLLGPKEGRLGKLHSELRTSYS